MKVLALFAAVVLVAADDIKEKRDVLLQTASPYYAPAVPHGNHYHAYADPARTLAYASVPAVGYAPAPAVGYAPAPAVGYAPASAVGYAPAPAISYAAPLPSIGYTAHAAAPAVAYTAPAAVPYPAYDDGQYFPGKYEKPTFPVV